MGTFPITMSSTVGARPRVAHETDKPRVELRRTVTMRRLVVPDGTVNIILAENVVSYRMTPRSTAS